MKKSRPSVSGIVMLFCCLLAAGCSPQPSPAESKSFRTVLTIAPSKKLRDQIQAGQINLSDLRKRGADFCLAAHSTRSQPGYSANKLSRDFYQFLLTSGAMSAAYDIEFQWATSFADEGNVSGSFRLAATREVSIPDESSWVVQAGWQAVPEQGEFGFRLPKPAEKVGPALMNDAVQTHVEALLSNSIESELHRLLELDVLKRFESRKVVYGYGDCVLEAAPQEDGIDCLAVLGLAQKLRDGELPPAFPSQKPVDWADIVSLARKVCGLMRPKEWRSVARERLEARPVLLSKNLVVLELAIGGKRLVVNRNAFTDEGEKLLLRMEDVAVEFVARVNAATASAAKGRNDPAKGVDPHAIETPQEIALPEPLTGRDGAERIGP
jgi:hypothetical protein